MTSTCYVSALCVNAHKYAHKTRPKASHPEVGRSAQNGCSARPGGSLARFYGLRNTVPDPVVARQGAMGYGGLAGPEVDLHPVPRSRRFAVGTPSTYVQRLHQRAQYGLALEGQRVPSVHSHRPDAQGLR